VVPPAGVLKSHITLGEPGIKIILDALPLLPGQDDRDQPVSLEIKGEYLTLKAKGKDDWTEIPIPATVSGSAGHHFNEPHVSGQGPQVWLRPN
jgi:hypothetical protein